MSSPSSSSFHTWVDTINKLLQMVALFIVAGWTIAVFVETSAPGLETKFSLKPNIEWNSRGGDDECDGMFSVEARTDGSREIDIRSAVVTGWLFDRRTLTPPTATNPTLIELATIEQKGNKFYDGSPDPIEKDLCVHYAPGAAFKSEVHFAFRKAPGQIVVFRLDVAGVKERHWIPFDRSREINDYVWTWDWTCGFDSQVK